MNKINLYILLGTVLMCVASLSDAQQPSASAANLSHPDREAPGISPPHGPPPEAFSACEGKAAGTQSSFTSPRGDTVKGTCENDGSGKVVLRPEHAKSSGPAVEHRGPPPEAYTACKSKTAGSRTLRNLGNDALASEG